jgi:hypothetical protein
LTDHRMFSVFTDDQARENDIDTLKRWLRPKLGGYTVTIPSVDFFDFASPVWPDRLTLRQDGHR